MSKLKKLTQQQLFLPIFCMILVLCVNMIYDVSQGRDFYEFFKIGIQNELLSGRLVNILNRGSEVAILAIGMTIGLMPVIGIPLPMLSYGGSSLLAFSVLIFIFLALNRQENKYF